MTRHPYPAHDFECLYRHTCPYLDGLSTTWVLGEYRRADNVYHEHLRIIDDFYRDLKDRDNRIRFLERENAELKAKLQALHQRQFKPSKKKDAEDIEGDASSKEGKRKRGAPVGHPGWVRPKPDRIDRTVDVPAPTTCRRWKKAWSTFRKISSSDPVPWSPAICMGRRSARGAIIRLFRQARASF